VIGEDASEVRFTGALAGKRPILRRQKRTDRSSPGLQTIQPRIEAGDDD
jgi:hypothetical protein